MRQIEEGTIKSAHQAAVLAGWTERLIWCRASAVSFASQATRHLAPGDVRLLVDYLTAPETIPRRTPARGARAA